MARFDEKPLLKDCLPLKLADRRLDKCGDGHKMKKKLLQTRQRALCNDIPDKLYGFIELFDGERLSKRLEITLMLKIKEEDSSFTIYWPRYFVFSFICVTFSIHYKFMRI